MQILDVQYLAKDINKLMPRYTEDSFVIPDSPFGELPKNIPEFSNYKINKFLNKHHAEIEEADHQNLLSKEFLAWYVIQNSKYHNPINFKGDLFFKSIKNKLSNYFLSHNSNILACGFIMGNLGVGKGPTCTAGADSEVGDTSAHTVGWSNQNAGSRHLLTKNRCYDRVAVNVFATGSGNQNIGVYDNGGADTGNTATNLLESTGAHALATGFNWKSLTEFTIPDDVFWVVQNCDSITADLYYGSSGSQRSAKNPVTYPTLEDPTSGWTYASNFYLNTKLGHT